jgi:voltage-gated potassium channel Kch
MNSKDALSKSDVSFSQKALIICGYGEVGKSLYDMLKATRAYGAESGGVVCFDWNPTRVSAGVMAGAPVVFGDGAKLELLKAAGVTQPRAIVITYASDARRLETTMRLRSSLPNTPIYVYEGNSRIGQELLDAGATEVISVTTETILRFGQLLGICKTQEDADRLRQITMDATAMTYAIDEGEVMVPGLSEEALIDLAEEVGCTRGDITNLWEAFSSIADNRVDVPISEVKEMLMRQARDGPSDGKFLDACLRLEDEDGAGKLTFVEYVRAITVCSVDLL